MKKILIIRFSSLGDIILTFPVLKNIKLNDKNIKIFYLTKKNFSAVLRSNPNVDKVLEFNGFLNTISLLRKEKFDILIDLHSNLRSFIFTRFIISKIKIRYNKDSIYRRLFVNFRYISPRLKKHVVEKYLETISKLGFKIYSKDLEIENVNLSQQLEKKPKKILIIQTAFLGDLFLTLPMIKEIKSKIKDSYVAILIRGENEKAVEKVEGIDEIISDWKTERSFFSEFKRLLTLIKSKNFEIAIIPHRSLRSAMLAFLAGIKIRIGFDIKPASLFYTHVLPFEWLIHDSKRNSMLLSPLIGTNLIEFPEIKEDLGEKFSILSKISPLIVLNTSSVWPTKRWPDYKFIELSLKLYEKYKAPVVLIGSKKEESYIKNIENALREKCINITGKTTLGELISIIKKADVLITNDSGPMHIASATSTPVIAIFGPTTRELGFYPWGKHARVIEKKIKCRPCRLHGSNLCPRGHFLCMKTIKVNDVLNETQKILKYKYG
ncbi:MAG: lipopolysaccharide heptosyltransferase II [Elusimicrobiota bacterium]